MDVAPFGKAKVALNTAETTVKGYYQPAISPSFHIRGLQGSYRRFSPRDVKVCHLAYRKTPMGVV